MSKERKVIYEFGRFRLDPEERQLLHQGRAVDLTPKAFSLLVILVENAGRLLTKARLKEKLWPDTHVDDSNLTVTIRALRLALGNRDKGSQYIETVPREGYRFVSPVTMIEEVNQNLTDEMRQPPSLDFSSTSAPSANKEAASSRPAPKSRSLWVRTIALCMIAALAAASGLYWSRVREKERQRVPAKGQAAGAEGTSFRGCGWLSQLIGQARQSMALHSFFRDAEHRTCRWEWLASAASRPGGSGKARTHHR